jgi:integrase
MLGRVHLKPKTVAGYRSVLDSRIKPRWESVRLVSITNADVVAWVAEMRKSGLSASRVRQCHYLLRSMLDDAVRDRRLASNPAAGVKLPRLPRRSHRYLTHEQIAALADASGDYRVFVLTLAYTGLRFGEATALRVRHVDTMRGRIKVEDAVTEIAGHVEWGTPKTHQARTVPLPAFLRDELAQHVAGRGQDALVFPSPWGSVLRTGNFRRGCFDKAARRVGLEGLTPHQLRHTAASLGIAAGATVKGVQAMLGHANATTTLDIYAGLFDDELDAVADRLDAAARDVKPRYLSDTSTPVAT